MTRGKFFVCLVSFRWNNKTQYKSTTSCWIFFFFLKKSISKPSSSRIRCSLLQRQNNSADKSSALSSCIRFWSDVTAADWWRRLHVAFRICWCVETEVVWVRFCTSCQPIGAAGLSWGLSPSPSLTLVGRVSFFLSFFFFSGEQMSPATFFLTHSPQPIAARGRVTTSPSHSGEGALMINKRYSGGGWEGEFKAWKSPFIYVSIAFCVRHCCHGVRH